MAQNLWKLAGKPTSFNPLPSGLITNKLALGVGEYTVTIRARSASNRMIKVWVDGETSDNFRSQLTPVTATYTYAKKVVSTNVSLYIADYLSADNDIVIEGIEVVKAPLPQLPTLHNLTMSRKVGALTAEKAFTDEKILALSKVSLNGNPLTKQGTASVKANFDGKVAGSTDLVPHDSVLSAAGYGTPSAGLLIPGNIGGKGTNGYQSIFANIMQQDLSGRNWNTFNNGAVVQQLFSFDLIRLMTDKFGSEFFADAPDLASKVNKLKTILTKIQADWWGFGSTVLSNYAGNTDFAGKVAGSTVENANVAKRTSGSQGNALVTPASPIIELTSDGSSVSYNRLQTLDGTVTPAGTGANTGVAQQLFSFNLIEYIKRKYGYTPDVAWLKANVTKLTANWHGFGTNAQANPAGTTDFAGKVTGSTVENANVASFTASAGLKTPAQFVADNLVDYSKIASQNSVWFNGANLTNGNQAQTLFSFDLIAYIKAKYGVDVPGADTASKVQWLKDNATSYSFKWYGFGSSPAGNKATIAVWNGSSWTTAPWTHSNGTVTLLQANAVEATIWRQGAIDANGFVHFLAYAEASDGVTASTINTDYVSLDVTLKAGGNKAQLAFWLNDINQWYIHSAKSHTNGTVTKISLGSDWINSTVFSGDKLIDANGFIHYLAYADPSNGISPSTINTDYISLDVEVDAGSNKASFAGWNATIVGWQASPSTHALGTVAKLSHSNAVVHMVDSNGMTHFLAYADPSNGVKPSTINTDYIELTVDVNLAEAGYDVWVDSDSTRQLPKLIDDPSMAKDGDNLIPPFSDSRWTFDPNMSVQDEETVVLNATAIDQKAVIELTNLKVGETYTYNAELSANANIEVYFYDSVGVMNPTYGGQTKAITFSVPAGAIKTSFRLTNRNTASGTFTFRRPTLHVGNQPQDYRRGKKIMRKRRLNFLGKVAGSADSVPHRMKARNAADPTTFQNPTVESNYSESSISQAGYDTLGKQDGATMSQTTTTIGNYRQQLFEFDLSHLGLSLADLKSALRKLTVTWVGYGKGDNAGVAAFGATLKVWNASNSSWAGGVGGWQNTASAPAVMSNQALSPEVYPTTDQKVYILVHSTYPAGAASPSEIYTDYVKLDVELADWVDYVKTNAVKVKTSDPTKVKLAFANTRDVVDIDYVKNDPRVRPKKNLIPTQPEFWVKGSGLIYCNYLVPVTPGATYNVKVVQGYTIGFNHKDGSKNQVGWTSYLNSMTITIPATTYYLEAFIQKTGSVAIEPAEVVKAKPMLVEGSVAVDFEPYQLIGGYRDVIASRKVPKKNLYTKTDVSKADLASYHASIEDVPGVYGFSKGLRYPNNSAIMHGYQNFSAFAGKAYTFSAYVKMDDGSAPVPGLSGAGDFSIIIAGSAVPNTSVALVEGNIYRVSGTLTVGTTSSAHNSGIVKYTAQSPKGFTVSGWQIEEGTTTTAYEDFKLLDAKPSKPGLILDGQRDYLQLPSTMMDAIEIDCLIDGVQGMKYMVDARPGLTNGYFWTSGSNYDVYGNGWTQVLVNGNAYGSQIPRNQRIKLRLNAISAFTQAVSLMGTSTDGTRMRSIIYGIKLYLNGQVIKEYSAEDLLALVGGKLLPKYKDLIPDFYDKGWSFHANARVYGKEWMKHTAAANYEYSYIDVPVEPNTDYYLKVNHNGRVAVYKSDLATLIQNYTASQLISFNSGANTSVSVVMGNFTVGAGTFEFSKPQLYKLDGSEPTVGGSPLPKIKTPRRILDNVR